jgi:hypothetical protein
MVRRDARDTEIAAAAKVQRGLSALQQRVLQAFVELGGSATDEQLETRPQFAELAPSTVRKRRSELLAAGLIVADGERMNSRGAPMTLWRLTGAHQDGEPESVPASFEVSDRVRIVATREVGEVVAILDEFQPRFAQRFRVHRSLNLFDGLTTEHAADELERVGS